jgi:hypothetical protein
MKPVSARRKHAPVLKEAVYLRGWERAIVEERYGQVGIPGLDLFLVCGVDEQQGIALLANPRHRGEVIPVPVGGHDFPYVSWFVPKLPQVTFERGVALAAAAVDEHRFVPGDEVGVSVPRMGDLPA